MKNIVLQFAAIIFITMFFGACSKKDENASPDLYQVGTKASDETLFYSGIIRPIKSCVITSPADGVIIKKTFQYGEFIQKGQLLFELSSNKYLSDYKSALMTYIKNKSEYNASITQLAESKFLHQHQLISEDEFRNKKSNYYSAKLALLQAKDALAVYLNQLDLKGINLYSLNISDFEKINNAMHLKMTQDHLQIVSSVSGIVLAANKNDDDSKKLATGDAVKQADVLAMIGDMSGIRLRIKINEITINKLTIGQQVKVTGMAFKNHILLGKIGLLDQQAEVNTQGLPSFSADIVVPNLTPEQRKIIHVGMSAEIEINLNEMPNLSIPLSAIFEKNGASYVMKYDRNLKQSKKVLIKTGHTNLDAVTILSGLKAGDEIVRSY